MKFKPPIFQGNNSPYIVPLWSMRMMCWVMFTTWVMILAMIPFSSTKRWMISSVNGIFTMKRSFWKVIMLGTSIKLAMSSFGVKSILRKNIVTGAVCYKNSEEMYLHLRKAQPERTHADKTMIYQHIDPVKINAKRMNRSQLPISGCMKQHLFDYKPRSKKILCQEYLCDCL